MGEFIAANVVSLTENCVSMTTERQRHHHPARRPKCGIGSEVTSWRVARQACHDSQITLSLSRSIVYGLRKEGSGGGEEGKGTSQETTPYEDEAIHYSASSERGTLSGEVHLHFSFQAKWNGDTVTKDKRPGRGGYFRLNYKRMV